MKTKWLDRELITGPYIALVLSEKGFHAAMRHCKIPKTERSNWIKSPSADATAHTLINPSGDLCCIVALRRKPNMDPNGVVGLLVHESVHIWQQFKAHIGENNPSSEFEAYVIQSIAQRLISDYSTQTASKRKK